MDIYLVDGNSYFYRAYYAIRGLTDSKGRPTNAVFGFTNMLMKIIRERRPDGLLVSFDTPHPTARHELFEGYKAGRPETPDDLLAQIPGIKDVVGAMRIPVFEVPGFEADDVLATLAEKAAGAGMDVYIVSSDKDMLQLVGGPVRVYDPMKDLVIDEGHVRERFGVPPGRVIEYMALVGDPSDNIPGVKGVGEKTARELLSQFGTLDELMAHPEMIKKERTRKLIEGGIEDIRLSRELARINRDVPIEAAPEDFRMREPDWGRLRELFMEYEFTSLLRLLPAEEPEGGSYEAVFDPERLREVLSGIRDGFAVDTEATGRDPLVDRLVGFSICPGEGRAAYVPLMHDYEGAPSQMKKGVALEALKPLMEDGALAKTGHNLKYDILILRGEGVETRGVLYDTMVASYLLNPQRPGHSLENVALEYLGVRKTPFKEVAGRGGFGGVEVSRAVAYACLDAELALRLREVLFSRLGPEGLERTYFEMEMPLIYVLSDMEQAGMKLDAEKLGDLGGELERELDALSQRIYFFAGGEFNLNSPKQLAAVLFEDLGLRPGKRKKTGYSTDVSVLEELAREHELPRDLLTWRSLAKLKNTYVDVLPRMVNPRTGRLHTSFNQAVTATGRLSSSEPNLQNIPVRGEWGARIREAFVAEEGCVIISGDYSQIELRILAHLSGDRGLMEAFTDGLDVHARTAAEIFGVREGKVTPEMRRVAKTVNFGIIYGITPFGLSESLGISRQDAEAYINGYFARHPGVGAYIDRALREAREGGFVRTLFGRKRPVPELSSGNRNTRLLGERLAVNSPVQGSAADIIKMAMIRISNRLRGEVPGARMVLQVHDELVLEAPEGERDRVSALLREEMQAAAGLSVPVEVDIGSGKNWAEAH